MTFLRALFVFCGLLVSVFSGALEVPAKKIIFAQQARIGSLDPYLLSGIDSFTVTGYVIEPLARIDPYTQNLEPCLALSWTVNESQKTIRLILRKGVKFHNGQEFTAEDVRFTWASYFDPEYNGEVWRGMWDQVAEVKVLAPDIAEFKMKELSFQQFKNVISSLRILPHKYYGKVNHKEWTEKLIGSGPFKTARFEAHRSLELLPNEDWWGWEELNLPTAPHVVIKSGVDSKLAEQMLAKGELDLYEIPSGENYIGETPPREAKTPFGRGFSLGVNLRKPALQDIRLRQALLLLWNRAALNQKIYGGKYHLALDSYSPAMYYYPRRTATAYDPEKAKQLLKKIGFKEGGEPLRLKLAVHGVSDERWAGLFQTDAAKLGIQIRIVKTIDEGQWWHLLKEGRYDLAAFDGAFSEAPHSAVVHSKGAYNNNGFANAKVDRTLDQLEKEFNSKKRRKLYRTLIASIRDQVIEIPGLYTNTVYYLASPDVTYDAKFPSQAWRWRKKD